MLGIMIAFLIGLVNGFMVITLFTNRYAPGKKHESGLKFIGYTILIAIPLNLLVLKLINL